MSKKYHFFLLPIFLLLTLTASAQDSTPVFTLYSDQPVVPHSDKASDWDFQYTDPGAVIYHDGKFHMFRNGFNGWPASVQIGYETSDDGLKWTEVSPDPVMLTKDVPYAKVAALASDVVVQDDGTWVMYFYTWNTFSGTGADGAIGRATAKDPAGPWTPDAEPVLKPGSKGTWDELRVSSPRVVKTEDGYTMYYSGSQKSNGLYTRVGMATSTDGITWTKYDDPATTDALYAESDPILETGDKRTFVGQPMVQPTPDGWTMIYRTATGSQKDMRLGYALSKDGIHWAYDPKSVIWKPDDIPTSVGFWYTAFVYHDDTYYLYIENGVGSHTQIYAATHKGSLAEQ
ncbi:MAG: hypothetical protein GC179_06810 [Anaerolineaceae bacterium]|nr:hypothetical protein [Anaerolineaceae bacterium]